MRFFTSDHHFGHANIIDFVPRPFRDVKHMNEMLVHNWNERVTDNDDVIVVGDFAMGQVRETIRYALRLNGNKFLVPGNHDRCWPGGKKDFRSWEQAYDDVGFTVLQPEIVINIGVVPVIVCHFPYVGDSRDKDRYSGSRPTNHGNWLIHGHTHSMRSRIDKMIHVGVDAWDYFPVPEDWIKAMIKEGTE